MAHTVDDIGIVITQQITLSYWSNFKKQGTIQKGEQMLNSSYCPPIVSNIIH